MTLVVQVNDRQKAIMNYIADGLTKKEIAGRMNMSESNVAAIVNSLIQLFDCRNSAGLVDFAWKNGIRKL